MYLWTKRRRSITLDKIGTTEIGLKTDGVEGVGTLGIGLIVAIFHCVGTWHRLKRYANISEMAGTKRHSNQAGRASMWCRRSKEKETSISEKGVVQSSTVSFSAGFTYSWSVEIE